MNFLNFKLKIYKIPAEQVNNSKVLKYCNFLFNNPSNLKKILKFIEESKFSDKEAIEVLNTSCTYLLADKKPGEAAETIKKSLEYNPHNEETLEIGIATSLLSERSTGQAPWYLCRPKGRVQAALAPYPPAPDVLYIV